MGNGGEREEGWRSSECFVVVVGNQECDVLGQGEVSDRGRGP
jgi:hypothetical protein